MGGELFTLTLEHPHMIDDPVVGLPPDLHTDEEFYALAPKNLWHLPEQTWEKVWDRVTGKSVKIAILDTGMNDHPDLPTPIATASFIRGESYRDGNGHGTHCAGTALGRHGIGVAPDAQLIVGKVLSNRGSGSSSGIAEGIRWAVDQGADIISMSLGGGSSYDPTNDNIDYAFANGCLVNVAAGNSGYRGRNTIGWPAKYPGAICCGATRVDGKIASFSSGGRELDWANPGQNIVSTSASGGYVSMSGTSMATPFGSGVLALVVELMRREGLSQFKAVDAVREFFSKVCEDRGEAGNDVRFGRGVPVAEDIIELLINDDLEYV